MRAGSGTRSSWPSAAPWNGGGWPGCAAWPAEELADIPAARVPGALIDLAARPAGPDLAAHLARTANRDQFAEYLIHRSVYQLKEADPHSFGIQGLDGPRLRPP